MAQRHPAPVRGVNPEPEGGWSWALSEYEIAYVREFNARPPRENWNGTPEDERRLEQEADGIRAVRRPARRRVRRNWPWVTAAAMLTVVTVAGAGAGSYLLWSAHDLDARTATIREVIAGE